MRKEKSRPYSLRSNRSRSSCLPLNFHRFQRRGSSIRYLPLSFYASPANKRARIFNRPLWHNSPVSEDNDETQQQMEIGISLNSFTNERSSRANTSMKSFLSRGWHFCSTSAFLAKILRGSSASLRLIVLQCLLSTRRDNFIFRLKALPVLFHVLEPAD